MPANEVDGRRVSYHSSRSQLAALKTHDRAKQRELQKQIASRQQDVKSIDENKSLLDQSYGPEASRQRLFADYVSLQTLAQNFGGHTYNLNDPSDRQAMKLELLRSLRPEAFKVLQELERNASDIGDKQTVVSRNTSDITITFRDKPNSTITV